MPCKGLIMGVIAFANVIASSGGPDPLLRDIGICLLLAGLLCAVCARFKVPIIAAFLAAGFIIGPNLAGVITDRTNVETISNLGLILLLFVIGLEINVKKLLSSGKTLFLSGILQFPLCAAFGAAAALAFGFLGWDDLKSGYVPLYVGFALSSSSTLIVVKLMQEKFQLDTVVGRISLGILIFQDVWSIVILAAQPNFASPEIGNVLLTFGGIAFLAAFSMLFSKYILPSIFRWIARSPELVLVVALGWCFGVGLLGSNLGSILGLAGIHLEIRVSMEMGALIAGASIASLPYSHEAVSKVGVVRDFFVTLFFVGLGMGIPMPENIRVVALAAVLVVLALASRFLVFFPLLYFTGLDRRNSMVASSKLAQISEFTLVIAYIGVGFGHIGGETASAVIFAFVATALATPLLFGMGDFLHDRLGPLLSLVGFKTPEAKAHGPEDEDYDLALLGFHRVAYSLLHEIGRKSPDLMKKTLVVDFNVALHGKIRETGAVVKYGDISNPEVLHHLGVDRARVILSTIHDDILKGTSNLGLVKIVRKLNPKAKIIANALDFPSAKSMYEAGADYVYLYRVEAARSLVPAIYSALIGEIDMFRSEQEEQSGGPESRKEILP